MADKTTAPVLKMARRNIFLARGILGFPIFFISFDRTPSHNVKSACKHTQTHKRLHRDCI